MARTHELQRRLLNLFEKHRVVDLKRLFLTLKTKSRMTVFRHLRNLRYISSYSHAGRYYTLADIPTYDEDGLWQFQGILFSQHDTLKATVIRMVEDSSQGLSQGELKRRLRLRVQDTLNDLIRTNTIGREKVGSQYIYKSSYPDKASRQISCRLKGEEEQKKVIDPYTIIEILLEIIHSRDHDPSRIAKKIQDRGKMVTSDQIEKLFTRYALDGEKK